MINYAFITKDKTFFCAIQEYIKNHARISSWISLYDTLDETRNLSKDEWILVVDETIQVSSDHSFMVIELVLERTNHARQVCKYQKFEMLLDELKVKTGKQHIEETYTEKIIGVTSFVGGSGKTTFLKACQEGLSKKHHVLSLTLIGDGEGRRKPNLADLCFDNFAKSCDLRNYDFIDSSGLNILPGFQLPKDFVDFDPLLVIASLREYMRGNKYSYLLIELPPLVHEQTQIILQQCDIAFMILDNKRTQEEDNLRSCINMNIQGLVEIKNRSSKEILYHLPHLMDESEYLSGGKVSFTSYMASVNQILLEMGLKYA